LTAGVVAGTATITGTINGAAITDDADVAFNVGAAAAATTTITANPIAITADGQSTSTITVQAKDANGNNLAAGGDAVVLATTLGALGAVADNGDGTYTATLTAGVVAGTATITGTINGAAITDDADVAFNVGAAAAATTTITANPIAITADGQSTSTITVQAKDANGNNLAAGGDAVVLATTLGALGAVADNNDGTYTATLTAGVVAGIARITGLLNGQEILSSAEVEIAIPEWIIGLKVIEVEGYALISWDAVTDEVVEVRIHRRELDDEYRLISAEKPESGTFQDRSVESGISYLYQLEGVASNSEKRYRSQEISFATQLRADSAVKLEQPFPNPSSGYVTVQYFISKPSPVDIAVFNSFGSPVLSVRGPEQGVSSAGWFSIRFSVGTLPSGTYTVVVRTNYGSSSRSFVAIRQ